MGKKMKTEGYMPILLVSCPRCRRRNRFKTNLETAKAWMQNKLPLCGHCKCHINSFLVAFPFPKEGALAQTAIESLRQEGKEPMEGLCYKAK